jgi:hypothetical protein
MAKPKKKVSSQGQAAETRYFLFLPLTKFSSMSIPNYRCLAPWFLGKNPERLPAREKRELWRTNYFWLKLNDCGTTRQY